jgi:hypothetical protein
MARLWAGDTQPLAPPRWHCAAACRSRARRPADAVSAQWGSGDHRSYTSRRSLRLTLADDPRPGAGTAHFLRDTERVVVLAFPDESRRLRVGQDSWRVTLLPFDILWWSIRAACTLRTWNDERSGELKLAGRELHLQGLPPEVGAYATCFVCSVCALNWMWP